MSQERIPAKYSTICDVCGYKETTIDEAPRSSQWRSLRLAGVDCGAVHLDLCIDCTESVEVFIDNICGRGKK